MGGHVTGGIGLLKGNSYVTVYLKRGCHVWLCTDWLPGESGLYIVDELI